VLWLSFPEPTYVRHERTHSFARRVCVRGRNQQCVVYDSITALNMRPVGGPPGLSLNRLTSESLQESAAATID